MKRLICIFVVCLFACQLGAQFGSLSKIKKGIDTAKKVKQVADAIRPLNEKEEFFLGKAVAAQLLAKYKLMKNDALTRYVSLVGDLLALRSDRPEIYQGYHFAVLDTEEVNAFAAPGGTILLTSGLVRTCANEDELAAVLAHEVSHIVARDPVKMVKQSRLQGLVALGVEELDRGSAQVVGIFKDSVMDVTGTILEKGYSRSQEKDADLAALDLLSRCGYAPSALVTMLTKLQAGEVKKLKIYSAHPSAKDRCKYTEKGLKEYDAGKVLESRTSRFKAALQSAGL